MINSNLITLEKAKESQKLNSGTQSMQKQDKEEKKQQKYRKHRKSKRKSQSYHWNQIQEKRYLKYLCSHVKLFDASLQKRRENGVHVKMSKFIKKRNPSQCRSHHQKMMIKYGSVKDIIENLSLFLQEPQKNQQVGISKQKEIQITIKAEQNGQQAGVQLGKPTELMIKVEDSIEENEMVILQQAQSGLFYKSFQ